VRAGPGGQDDETGLDHLTAGQFDPLALSPLDDASSAIADELDRRGPQSAHGVDQFVVAKSSFQGGSPRSRRRGKGGEGVGHAQGLDERELFGRELFAAEIRRIGSVGVDDRHLVSAPGQDQGQDRSGEPGADDRDLDARNRLGAGGNGRR
jgi:hypothetical protein